MKETLRKCLLFLEAQNIPGSKDLIREVSTHVNGGHEIIGYVHRDDLKSAGYDTENVTDDQLEELARDLMEAYSNVFWADLEILADIMGIRKSGPKPKVDVYTRDPEADFVVCHHCGHDHEERPMLISSKNNVCPRCGTSDDIAWAGDTSNLFRTIDVAEIEDDYEFIYHV